MKYLSLFSGIGGFECAIERVFPEAECIGFSEIDKDAIAIYKRNFPLHSSLNIGNIEEFVYCENDFGEVVVNEDRIASLPDFDLLVGVPHVKTYQSLTSDARV